MNRTIIDKIAEARLIIFNAGYATLEDDISHDYSLQKKVYELTKTTASDYPIFQFQKTKDYIIPIGNLDALKLWIAESKGSKLDDNDNNNMRDNDNDDEEQINIDSTTIEIQDNNAQEEPSLGFVSQSIQAVGNVMSTIISPITWVTSSWWPSPTVTPLSTNTDIETPSSESDTSESTEEGKEEEVQKTVMDFKVVQTNWYWRQQLRVIRINLDDNTLTRYEPQKLIIRAFHELRHLKEISCYDSQHFIQLTFQKSEEEPNSLVYEYYTTSASDYPVIIDLLKANTSVNPIIHS